MLLMSRCRALYWHMCQLQRQEHIQAVPIIRAH
jgi:hypothetical protein